MRNLLNHFLLPVAIGWLLHEAGRSVAKLGASVHVHDSTCIHLAYYTGASGYRFVYLVGGEEYDEIPVEDRVAE